MKTAVLIDLAFALKRYRTLIEKPSGKEHAPEDIVTYLWNTAKQHAGINGGSLYRILCYDCAPYDRGSTNPISNTFVDFRRTLTAKRKGDPPSPARKKVRCDSTRRRGAQRLDVYERRVQGDRQGWKTLEQLTPDDVKFDLRQKQVDMKLGLDVASLAYKRQVDRIVLIAGDSDFVPAAKLARREGIDFVLDPLWNPIDPDLKEHIDGLKSFWPKPSGAERTGAAAAYPCQLTGAKPEQLELE